MHYSIPIRVEPANTADNPAIVRGHFGAGVLRKVDVVFPPGPAGLVRIFIFHENIQILPTNPEGYYSGDDIHITAQCWINLSECDNIITVVGYNVGCNFPHTILLYFEVKDPDEPDLTELLNNQIRLMSQLVDLYKSTFW